MSKIVRTAADLLFVFVFVFGFYIVLHGHITPGGGFQGGAVIASGFIMLFVAHRIEDITALFTKVSFQNSEALGLSLFIGTALVAIGLGSTFLMNYLAGAGGLFGLVIPHGINAGFLNSAGVIPVMNIAVGIEVLGGLSIILIYMTNGIRMLEETE
jgi:multicomponent Na+:H+ antiporter subunit B